MTDFSASRSRTIIGAAQFHGRVRDGIEWFPRAMVARRNRVWRCKDIELKLKAVIQSQQGLGVGESSRTVD